VTMGTSITSAVGSIVSLLGMSGSLANQAAMIHRQMTPPQLQQQLAIGQHCPAGTRIVGVLVKPDGTRQLVCTQKQP
jgi:hypothetical protein